MTDPSGVTGPVSEALVLVDHGSRLPEANAVLDRIAEAILRRNADACVEVAHMELAKPSLGEAVGRCVERGFSDITVCPYFLGPGRHTRLDIPRLVEEARSEYPGVRIRIALPLGFDELLVEAVLARADAARAD